MNKLMLSIITSLTIIMLSTSYSYEAGYEHDPVQKSRISYVTGDAVIQPSISGNTLEAALNMPFMLGDRLATGSDGRIEFRLGDGVSGWLWHDTKVELSESSYDESGQRHSEIRIWYGAISIRNHDMFSGGHHVSVNAGHGQISLSADGLMRITMESDLTAVYGTVYKGQASVVSSGRTQMISSGETWRSVTGSGQWELVRPLREDAFDKWVFERDLKQQAAWSEAGDFPDEAVPPEYRDQASAFHGHGRWVYVQNTWYWAPFVASSWVPYHFGYWDFIPGWGWFWVSFEPWGWTAYRYGYWRFFAGFGWMWYPNWRWRGHHAHWRYTGRSVHWVAAHPDDDMDAYGRLKPGAEPLNSKLAIGIPVEAGQPVDQMLNRIPVQRNMIQSLPPADNAVWRSDLPETVRPSAHRRSGTDHSIGESSNGIHSYSRGHQRQYPRSDSRSQQLQPGRTHPGITRPHQSGAPTQPYRRPQSRNGTSEIQQRPGSVGQPQPPRPQQPPPQQQTPPQIRPEGSRQTEQQRSAPRRPPPNTPAPPRPESLRPDNNSVSTSSVLGNLLGSIARNMSLTSSGNNAGTLLRNTGKAADLSSN